jgi:transcriptional regulator with GAF, ATPase, and Fis domain
MSYEFLAKHNEHFESGIHLLLASIVNCFPETMGADSSEVMLYDSRNGTFTFAASTGDRDTAFEGRTFKCQAGDNEKVLAQRVMESKNPLIIDDTRDYPMCLPDRDMVDRLGIKSVAVFPLLAGGRFIGSISFDYMEHAHRYTREDVNSMHSLSDLAALMISYAEKAAVPTK